MSTLSYGRRRRFVNAFVSQNKMSYKEEDGAVAHTKGNTIVMPKYDAAFTAEQDIAWTESLITQCYANLPTNKPDVAAIKTNKIDMDSGYGWIYNTVCKHNQQMERRGELFGADEIVDRAYQETLMNIDRDGSSPEAMALQALDITSRLDWQLSTDHGFVSGLDGRAKELYDELLPLLPEYKRLRTSGKENVELANKIAAILEQENENQSNSGEDSQDQEGEEGGEGESQEGQGKDGDEKEGEKSEGSVKPKQVKPKPESKINGEPSGPLEEQFYDTGEHLRPVPTEVVVPKEDGANARFSPSRTEDIINSTQLTKKVRNILKVYSQAKYQGGKKKGKINKKAIASITTGNDAIFRKKVVSDTLDTAVMLLVDSSGSMAGHNYLHASASACIMVECLQSLNIPVSAYGFSYNWDNSHNTMFQLKTFNEKVDKAKMVSRVCSSSVFLAGNSDAESLLFGYDKLMQQKQKRKIMIVLSDGEPADGYNPHQFLIKVAKDIENSHNCELYSIGINTTAVTRYYKNNVVLEDPAELESKLLEVIKSSIIS